MGLRLGLGFAGDGQRVKYKRPQRRQDATNSTTIATTTAMTREGKGREDKTKPRQNNDRTTGNEGTKTNPDLYTKNNTRFTQTKDNPDPTLILTLAHSNP